jgi:hypothetical protein
MAQRSFKLCAIYRCVCSTNDITCTPQSISLFCYGKLQQTEVAHRWELVCMFHDVRGRLDPNSLFNPLMLRPHRALRYVRYATYVRYVRYTKCPNCLRFVQDTSLAQGWGRGVGCPGSWGRACAVEAMQCMASTAHARPSPCFKI